MIEAYLEAVLWAMEASDMEPSNSGAIEQDPREDLQTEWQLVGPPGPTWRPALRLTSRGKTLTLRSVRLRCFRNGTSVA